MRTETDEALDAEFGIFSAFTAPQNEWRAVAHVLLLHQQTCRRCGTLNTWSHGWYTRFIHASDQTASRFTPGRTPSTHPIERRIHTQPPVPICQNCWETTP